MNKTTSILIASGAAVIVMTVVGYLLGRSSADARHARAAAASERGAAPVVDVTVGNAGFIWGTGPGGTVFEFDGNAWQRRIGIMNQIDAGVDGTLWGLSDSGRAYRWTGKDWKRESGRFQRISVGSKDHIWAIDPETVPARLEDGKWVSGKGKLLRIGRASCRERVSECV